MKNKTVLIIDDETIVRLALKKILKKHNYEPSEVKRGLDAIELIEKETYDYYLVDFLLEDITGIDFYEKVKNKNPDAKVIFISGSIDIKIIKTEAQKITPNENIHIIFKPDLNEENLIETLSKISTT